MYCPMLMANPDVKDADEVQCVEDDCAWYMGICAVPALAVTLYVYAVGHGAGIRGKDPQQEEQQG